MARLRRDNEEKAYATMTKPDDEFGGSGGREEGEMTYSDANRQLTLIINVVVTVVACSVALWIAARHWSTASRLFLSLGGSTFVAAAEVVIYLGYIRRLTDAKRAEKEKVERKEVVDTWVIEGKKRLPEATTRLRKGEKIRPRRSVT